MSITFTFSFTLTCLRCGQLITTQDFSQGNCQVILPGGIIQHRTCPTKPPCHLQECATNQPTNFY